VRSNTSGKIRAHDRGKRLSKRQAKKMMQIFREPNKKSENSDTDVDIAPVDVDVPLRNKEHHDYIADKIRERLGKSAGRSLIWKIFYGKLMYGVACL
jgi:hypothetical protein